MFCEALDILPGEDESEIVEGVSMSKKDGERLPVSATSSDVREFARFMKLSPAGLPLLDVLNAQPRRIFGAQKLAAYEHWGIITRQNDWIKLTDLGKRLAEITTSESRIFEEVILLIPNYLAVIEWIGQRNMTIITHQDAAQFWNRAAKHWVNQIQNNKTSEAEAISFFNICHTAELGVATIGKRGQPTRLRIDLERVHDFLERVKNKDEGGRPEVPDNLMPSYSSPIFAPRNNLRKQVSQNDRIFISGEQNSDIVENLRQALELADLHGVVFDTNEQDDDFQSERLKIMRGCRRGVLIVKDDRVQTNAHGLTEVNGQTTTEIITALALFDRRVIIVWDSQHPIPEYFQQNDLNIVSSAESCFKTSCQIVKLLKDVNLKSRNHIPSLENISEFSGRSPS